LSINALKEELKARWDLLVWGSFTALLSNYRIHLA
jgi:hypothetical protein